MLREIINFTRSLSPDSFKLNLQPKEGLHIQIELDETGQLRRHESVFFRQRDEVTPFLQDCLLRQVNSIWISANKALDSNKKIHSCSPFCVAFRVKTISEIQDRLEAYFAAASEYCETEHHKTLCDYFKGYCLESLLKSVGETLQAIEKEQVNGKSLKISDKHYIYTYLRNASIDDCQATHRKYLSKRAFNKEELNREVDGIIYGVSDYLTGYNTKKPFLQHHTATFSINSRVTSDDALQLFKFSQLKANGQLPNPLPIFIEKEELNDEVVKIFNRDKISYSEIIRSVYEKTRDLGNYYLLNIQGSDVKDFDFVSSFRYEISDMRVLEVIPIGGTLDNIQLRTIFDFERKIVSRLFNGCLISTFEDGITVNYFFDFESQRNRRKATYLKQRAGIGAYQMTLKYRKAFYDYIYKSKLEALNCRIIYEVISTIILDEIKHDEIVNHKHSKEFAIKEKLNIWFSLFEYFDQPKNEGGDEKMANRILELQAKIRQITIGKNSCLADDDEFAFAVGHVLFYLLDLSESSNKTHALLEPFLQKSECNQLKQAISKIFGRYKHKVEFKHKKFANIFSQVMVYETEKDLKTLTPYLLGGYFSKNFKYFKTEEPNDETKEN